MYKKRQQQQQQQQDTNQQEGNVTYNMTKGFLHFFNCFYN